MAHLFYDHLIEWDHLIKGLDELGAEGEDRIEIVELAEETLHTEIFVVILDHLPHEKHDEFIELFLAAPYASTHLTYLHGNGIFPIEDKIRGFSRRIIEEILEDLETD